MPFISRQSDNAFVFYNKFHTLMKRRKPKKLSQFLKVHISEMLGAIQLKFGMQGDDTGQHFHHKKLKCNGATYM